MCLCFLNLNQDPHFPKRGSPCPDTHPEVLTHVRGHDVGVFRATGKAGHKFWRTQFYTEEQQRGITNVEWMPLLLR